jgi:hypothetical protein
MVLGGAAEDAGWGGVVWRGVGLDGLDWRSVVIVCDEMGWSPGGC